MNYKERIIKAYFEELEKDYKVNFFKEDHPLGTGGSLHLLKDIFDKSFFVTNCDVIIKADYSSLYDFHLKNDFDVTIVASAKQYIIPYGSCELSQDGSLSHINEKPKYDFLVITSWTLRIKA